MVSVIPMFVNWRYCSLLYCLCCWRCVWR